MIDRHIKKAEGDISMKPIQISSISNGAEVLSGCENKAFDENTAS